MNWFKKLLSFILCHVHKEKVIVQDPTEFLRKNYWNIREGNVLNKKNPIVLMMGPACKGCPYPDHLHLYLYYHLAESREEFDTLLQLKIPIITKSSEFEEKYGFEQRLLAFSIHNGLALYEIVKEDEEKLFY